MRKQEKGLAKFCGLLFPAPQHILLFATWIAFSTTLGERDACADDVIEISLGIEGTAAECELGLPSRLEGTLFLRGGPLDGLPVGTYEEDLIPIIDPVFGLVGTEGVSTFTFALFGITIGTVVTENESLIVGIGPSGELLVESEGVVVQGTGYFSDVIGGLMSSSAVLIDLESCTLFSLVTDLTLTLSGGDDDD